jgi:hypothetical protein
MHKGNKSMLPQKPCQHCTRMMSWRKSWAKNWAQVLYCSAACQSAAASARRAAKTGNANAAKAG